MGEKSVAQKCCNTIDGLRLFSMYSQACPITIVSLR